MSVKTKTEYFDYYFLSDHHILWLCRKVPFYAILRETPVYTLENGVETHSPAGMCVRCVRRVRGRANIIINPFRPPRFPFAKRVRFSDVACKGKTCPKEKPRARRGVTSGSRYAGRVSRCIRRDCSFANASCRGTYRPARICIRTPFPPWQAMGRRNTRRHRRCGAVR